MENRDQGDDELTWRWHDNVIHGLRFEPGEPEEADWRSEVVFDIDFILEWHCGHSGEGRFRVAPATLTFHDITDFAIAFDQGDSGGWVALAEWSIHRVERDRLDRPFDYWRWVIHLNGPPGGTIAFGASGFTQALTGEPVLVAEQRLPRSGFRRSTSSETL